MAPLISIVIPTNNRPKLLKHALQSAVRQQGFDDYEIIVSVNGYPPETTMLVQDFDCDKIKLHVTGQDLTIVPSWRYALSKASGDYTLIMADDDCLLPTALQSYAETIAKYNQPDFISIVNGWYGHSTVKPPRRNALRFVDWNKEGEFNPKEMLKEFFKFGHPTFTPTYNLTKKWILQAAADRGIQAINPLYPDYSLQTLALAFAKKAVVMKEPTILHGYATDSSGENSFGKREKLAWNPPDGEDHAIKLSPVKGYLFVNGWVETLLRMRVLLHEELCNVNIDWIRFYHRYFSELVNDGLWRDITDDTLELVQVISEAPKPLKDFIGNSPQMIALLERLQLIVNYKLWESIDTGLDAEWVGQFDNIFEASKEAEGIMKAKTEQRNLLKLCKWG